MDTFKQRPAFLPTKSLDSDEILESHSTSNKMA